MYKNLVYDLAHQESDSSVVRASNLYLEGHGFGSHWGLRKFFFWLFRLENASPLFIYFFNFVVTVSHNVYRLGIFFKFILTLISSITSLSPPMSFQLIGRVKGSTMSVAMVSSYSLNCNITQKMAYKHHLRDINKFIISLLKLIIMIGWKRCNLSSYWKHLTCTFGVTYELVCQLCRQKYIGETSQSAYTRRKEHLQALEQSSVMWRHSCEKHDRNVPGFTMNVTGMFQSDVMLRQISESIQINKVQQDKLINTQSEWRYFQIPRAFVTQSWDEPTNILSYDYCTVKLNSSILLLLLKTFLWETWRWRPRLHNEWLLLFCQFYFSVIVM